MWIIRFSDLLLFQFLNVSSMFIIINFSFSSFPVVRNQFNFYVTIPIQDEHFPPISPNCLPRYQKHAAAFLSSLTEQHDRITVIW